MFLEENSTLRLSHYCQEYIGLFYIYFHSFPFPLFPRTLILGVMKNLSDVCAGKIKKFRKMHFCASMLWDKTNNNGSLPCWFSSNVNMQKNPFLLSRTA